MVGIVAILLAANFVACGRMDNLDADDFSIFNDDIDSAADLRRYAPFEESATPILSNTWSIINTSPALNTATT